MYDTGNGQSDYKDVPHYVFTALLRYAQHRRQLGHFLTAILENDLGEAVARADMENIKYIRGIVLFVYNELPAECHGSPDKVKVWLAGKG